MKKNLYLALACASLTSICAIAETPDVFFMADFNTEATMKKATVGKDMEFNEEGGAIQFIDDGKGVTATDGYIMIPKGSYIATDFTDLPALANPADPENPYTSTYTVVFDVQIPFLGTYYCLWQTNPGNSSDAKLCINKAGNFGSGFLGGYDDTWEADEDTWYRFVLTCNQPDGKFGLYANGELIKAGESGNVSKIDGRYAVEDPGPLFFADNDGEDADIYCSKLMYFDKALDAEQVKALGDPSTEVTSAVEAIMTGKTANITVDNGIVTVNVDILSNVTIVNVAGQTVASASASGVYTWNAANAPTGIYVVRVENATGVTTSKVNIK